MERQKLTITITEAENGELPFEAFAAVVTQTIRILRDLDRGLSEQHQPSAQWQIIGASMSSPMSLTLAPKAVRGRKLNDAISPFLDDLARLEQGQPARHLSRGMQQRARKIVDSLGNGIVAVDFRSNGTTVCPTRNVASTIAGSLSATTYTESPNAVIYEIGSIEGTLDVISVHGGKDSVKVWDSRFNVPVLCQVSDQQLEDAKEALGNRVVVRGRIKSIGNRPQAVVDVFSIQAIRRNDELPQPDRVGPIDLFGDSEPADFLRSVPDDE